ncbi:N-acetylneuraminic acid mutarotase [Marinobacter pelagius]|uniref:N-acetylneuraminic acid mutarotase n=1 Tax=Marinobacter pelagius TaxID=379482 RepID=A0A366GIG6_9GAMM|nr:kelch repeat-containing protein [Marinobacter pelagius]RBP25695.1 N-acetylneuraminic acid mutarotase [Marinobacter pelagius]
MRDFRLCHTLRFILAACLFLTAFAAQAAPGLLVSTSPERTAPIALSGAQLNDLVYIFVAPETGIKQVDFYLDDPPPAPPRVTERLAPFDFNRTAADLTAIAFDTNSIPDGQHSVYARTTYSDGTSELLSATFTVNNSAPAFSFSETDLSFSMETGGNSQTQQVTLSSSTAGGETFFISDDANWLTVQPTTGTVPESISITADPSNLAAGQYSATVEATGDGVTTAYLGVQMTVVDPTNSAYSLMVSTASDRSSASGLNGSTVTGNIYVFVPAQSGMSQVKFYIDNPQKAGSPSQTESVAPYDMAGTARDDTAYPFDTNVLADGSHTVTAVVKEADGDLHEVTEFFTVANDMAALAFDPATLSGSRHVDNPEPLTATVDLSSSDNSGATFSLESNAPWLTATGNSGTTPATITVTADPAGLTEGTYKGKVTASASGYTSAELTYTLTITAGSEGILASPTSMTFNGEPDTTIASQTLDVSHSAGDSVDFTASTSMPWLSVLPTTGTTPESLTVEVDSSGLASGSYDAIITLTPDSGSAIDVPVTMVLASDDKCAPVPCSDVRVDLPYQLTFTEGQGYYPDRNGWGTGFTWIDEPASGSGYIVDNLDMNFLEGVLRYTTTSGISFKGNNSQDNALGVGFAAPNQITQISTQILDLPAGTGNYEQAGLWFGLDQDNYIKLVAISTPSGEQLHYLMELAGVVEVEKNLSVPGLIGADITFSMIVDPYKRTVDLKYQIEGSATTHAATLTPPDEFFSFDAAGIDPEIGTRSFTGIFATHRYASSPVTYLFDEFTLQASDGALAPQSAVDFISSNYEISYPTSMVWGPDDRLYVTELFGTIHALTFDENMNVIDDQIINSLVNDIGPRLTLGITVSPDATASNVDLWVAHSSPSIDNGEANSGIVTRLSGTNFANVEHRITGLPRAIANHSINSLHFGPDNRLYIAVGGNTGAGAPNDSASEFGERAEQPLSAAIVVADVFSASFDGTCANTSDMYGPPPCDVVPYATGLRNSYDFVFHSNGNVYATDNGLGVTGTYPPQPEPVCTGLGNTASYLDGGNNPGTQPDLLLLIQEGKYYGHPNPYRDECVFKDGSYQEVAPLPNYEPPLFNLGEHKSSNAIIEYSGGEGCVGEYLNGNLLITNYSVGDDIYLVTLDETGNTALEGKPLVTGLNDPLPMTKSPAGSLFVGQFGGSKLTALRPISLGCWASKAPAPIAVLDASGAEVDGKMYAVGGKNSSGHLNTLFIYDPVSDSWSQGANLPGEAVENPAAVSLNGKLYVFGGSTGPFSGAVNNAAVYNPSTNSWTVLADMPTARGGVTAQALNGLIYVIGGMSDQGASLNEVEVYNPSTNSWQTAPSLTYVRDNSGSAVLDGKIYVFGGRHREATGNTVEGAIRTVEMFAPANNSWLEMTPMPTGRRAMSVGSINGKAQIAGGEFNENTTSGVFEQNEEYDPATNTWRSLTKVPTPKHGAAAATIDGALYIMGGGITSGSSYTSSMEAMKY